MGFTGNLMGFTLWLCQNSDWKWWSVVPLKMVIFYSYVNVYQRVYKLLGIMNYRRILEYSPEVLE